MYLNIHSPTPCCWLQNERVGAGKCLFFVRINPKGVNEKSIETDIAVGEIQGSALDTFKALVADLYLPILQEQGSWGKMPLEHKQEFLAGKQHALGAQLQSSKVLLPAVASFYVVNSKPVVFAKDALFTRGCGPILLLQVPTR